MDFQDAPGKDTAPKERSSSGGGGRNANIMPGGKVDPRSKLYQRSVAGREGLGEYLKKLWNDGTDEADVFMAGVKSLMSRGHGYVGAYLDSKNPGRVYKENEAMAITDAVMSKEGIGEHPGNRLTRAKDEEGKKQRKEEGVARGGFGPKQAPGRKAMSVRQQRKEGPRPSGPGLPPDSRKDREGLGGKEIGPTSEWQNTLKDRMEGKATTADVIEAFQKEKQSRIAESPQEQAKRKKAKAEDRARETATPEEGAVPEEEGRLVATPVQVGDKFKELVQDSVKANLPINKNSLEDMIQETIDILEDEYDVDPEQARAAIFKRFNNKKINGADIVFDPSSGPDLSAKPRQQTTPAEQAPEEGPTTQKEDESSAGPLQPVEGRIKQDLGTEFKSQYDTFRKGLIDTERNKAKGAWDTSKEKYIQPDEAQLRDLVDLSIDEIKDRHGNIDEDSARSQLRKYLIDNLGIDPYEEGDTQEPDTPEAQTPKEQGDIEPKRPVTSKGGFKAPKQSARRAGGGGFGGASRPSPDQVKAIKDKVAQLPPDQAIKQFKQGTLFPAGLVTETSQTNPLEGGSADRGAPGPAQQGGGNEPPEAAGAGKPGQQSLFKKGTLSPRTGKGFGSKPSAPAPTQPATSSGRADRIKELMDSGMSSSAALKQMEKEGTIQPRAAKGTGGTLRGPKPEPKTAPEEKKSTPAKGRSPLDQVAKAVMSGIERDKAARESAGQFFNRVRNLIQKQAGKGASKSEVDQAAANAINQQKGRKTRNKTTNNAEYQEFAQSLRAMMR